MLLNGVNHIAWSLMEATRKRHRVRVRTCVPLLPSGPAGHRRIRDDPAEQAGLGAQHGNVGQAVPADGECHREVEQYLPGGRAPRSMVATGHGVPSHCIALPDEWLTVARHHGATTRVGALEPGVGPQTCCFAGCRHPG
jgi:hypothetical protein